MSKHGLEIGEPKGQQLETCNVVTNFKRNTIDSRGRQHSDFISQRFWPSRHHRQYPSVFTVIKESGVWANGSSDDRERLRVGGTCWGHCSASPPPLSQQFDGLRKCSVKINVETYFSWILNISVYLSSSSVSSVSYFNVRE